MPRKRKQENTPVLDDATYRKLVKRNVEEVEKRFKKDPSTILVSVQIEEDQIHHLNSGLTGRSRRLIPLPVLAKLLQELQKDETG